MLDALKWFGFRALVKQSRDLGFSLSFFVFILQSRPRQTKRYVQCRNKYNGKNNVKQLSRVSENTTLLLVTRYFPSGSRSNIAFKRHLYQLIVSRFLEFFSREKGDSCLYMYICIYICARVSCVSVYACVCVSLSLSLCVCVCICVCV